MLTGEYVFLPAKGCSCFAIFLNARKGDSIRIVLSVLTDAVEDKWIDQCRMEFVTDDMEKKSLVTHR